MIHAVFERWNPHTGRSISVRCLECSWVQYDICEGSVKATAAELTCPQCGAVGPVKDLIARSHGSNGVQTYRVSRL